MKNKRLFLIIAMLVTIVMTQGVFALPAGSTVSVQTLNDSAFNFFTGGSAQVDCEVLRFTSGEYLNQYLYTYKITNVNSNVNLNSFAVGIFPGEDAFLPGHEPSPGIAPAFEIISMDGQTAASVNYTFGSVIKNTQSSSLLWFVSSHAPMTANVGMLTGFSSGLPSGSIGTLLTPDVPEPATMILFGLGSLVMIFKGKKHLAK